MFVLGLEWVDEDGPLDLLAAGVDHSNIRRRFDLVSYKWVVIKREHRFSTRERNWG